MFHSFFRSVTFTDKMVGSNPKLMSSSLSNMLNPKITMAATKEMSKPLELKYPSLAGPPEVDPLDKEYIRSAVPLSVFKLESQAKQLVVKSIDRHRSLNADVHRSFYYAIMKTKGEALVLRRGLPLRLTLNLNRPIGDSDIIFLEFRLNDVDRTAFADGSFVRVKIEKGNLTQPNNEFKWAAVCDTVSENGLALHLQVRLADKTPLGHWSMRILATSDTYDLLTPFRSQIYILANPWRKDFQWTSEGAEIRRKEYVMADVGLVYAGYVESPVAVPWRFGQFDKKILESAVSLLKGLPAIFRSHLFKIIHHLSYMLHDTRGVVVERKNSARQWAGSPPILLKYAKKKKQIEGSGNNYVAPCVFITVCRALGIPARPVTFYNVLPENEGGLGVDRYYHYLGLLLHNLNDKNMWCYKVMPEVIVPRPDLPRPFSSTSWQCVSHFGPCSVATIRAGAVYRSKPYGTDFIYRMVKARYVNLKVEDAYCPIKVVPSRMMTMCSLVLTKAIGVWDADNIMGVSQIRDYPGAMDVMHYEVAVPMDYDGGVKKSHSVKCRLRTNESGIFDKVPKAGPTGVPLIDTLRENGYSVSGFYFDEELDIWTDLITSSNWWGEPIMAALVARSKLKSDVTAFFSFEISKVSRNGQFLSTLGTDQNRVLLKPDVEEMMKMQILFDEYSKHLKPGDMLRVNANIHVEEEDYDQYFEKFFGFLPLNVSIRITDQSSNNCQVYLSNMSSTVMKKCGLSIRELGTLKMTTLFSGLKLEPGAGVQANIEFAPTNPTGVYYIEARAVCKEGFTSAYAALSFNSRQMLMPNLPSEIFPSI